jgi:restriction system protein
MSSRSFIAGLNRVAREADRRAKARQRAEKALEREAAVKLRIEQKAVQQLSKQVRADYLASRQRDVDGRNKQLSDEVSALSSILTSALRTRSTFYIESLKRPPPTDAIFANRPDLAVGQKPTKEFVCVAKLGLIASLIPGAKAKHSARVAFEEGRASEIYSRDLKKYEDIVQKRNEMLRAVTTEIKDFNTQIDTFAEAVKQGDVEAISRYFELLLRESDYPYDFTNDYKAVYDGTSKHLVVDCGLPTLADLVPAVEKYKYNKSNDEITETKRAERIGRQLYAQTVAAISLRILDEIFRRDLHQLVDVVTLNVFVETIDDRNGLMIKPYILSVRAISDEFKRLNLASVDPVACLKGLAASISRSPSELVPVKPIVDINMVDPRFIQEQDILSSVDNRTNLMALTPSEFESLITNLFQRMGLETKLTLPSRDGGVDCVAFDQRPILGGKVVIQAKRYKHTVGVSSIRDLFGTMMNEGASKGILVTTSGYGKASFEFANGKPIELISGANLLYLLREHAGVEAKIEPPDDWLDYREAAQ